MARKSRKNIVPEETIQVAEYIRTAQYIRLSVEDNNDKGYSIDTQKLILDDYIARNINMKLYDTYIDNGATGLNFERKEFKRLLSDIDNGKIDCVIVKDLSRLGRNAIDTGFYIEKYFAEKSVRFISVTDNFDTDNPDVSGMMMPLKNIINEAYAIDISRKVKSQARQAMRDGDYLGARPTYGYLKDKNNCHKLVIDTEVAPIVKQIFEWFIGGMSMNEIVIQLNQRSIPPPSVYEYEKGIVTTKKLIGSGFWQTRTINKMLTEPIYTGNMVQGKTETFIRKQSIVTDKDKWITVKNTHEPIVSEEVFEQAQKRIEEIKEKSKKLKVDPYTENIYKGKVFCGTCGRPMHRSREKRKKYDDVYRFRCIANTRVARGTCDAPQITESELTGIIISAIKGQANAIVGKKQILLCSVSDKKQAEETAMKMKSLKQYVERNQNFLKSLYENLISKVITAQEYHAMKADYETKISDAVKQMHMIKAKQGEIKNEYEKYCDLSDATLDISKNNKLTAELINKLIDKVHIYKNKTINIEFNFENEFQKDCVVNVCG